MPRPLAAALLAVLALAALAPGSSADAVTTPSTPQRGGVWLAGDLHVHTTYSHDSYGGPGDDNTGPDEAYTAGHTVEGQFAIAASRGLDFLAITDHNDVRSQSDPGFASHGVIGLPAYEASLDGHAQMLGAERVYAEQHERAGQVRSLAQRLRADGGVFQINHPADGVVDATDPDRLDWGYGHDVVPDTVEVWNITRRYQPPAPSASNNDAAIRFWEGFLDAGEHVTATGGSDNHWVSTTAVQGVGQPTTWVYARDRSPAAILEGLRAGRTFIAHEPPAMGGPRLVIEADADADGTFESMMGDTVPAGTMLRVRVTGAPGSFVRVIGTGHRAMTDPVPVAGAEFVHTFTVPDDVTWVRAEVVEPDGTDVRQAACDPVVGERTTYCHNALGVLAMTSALYLDAPPASTG